MAANKDKTRAAAQKYLQKGQLDKAIREYQRLVEDDPKDVRTLLKIGDLQTRSGAHEKATETYGRVAQFYSEQGFFLKAVAVYKQILRLDSSLIEVNLKLADLYYQLGLMSDAANQYRSVSQLFEQQGRIEESIDILKKMVELDPDNVASRIKLAESYAKQSLTNEARAHFQAAADYLKSQHRIDDYIKVAERVIHFDPSDLATTRELANIYIQKNDPRRALAKLQVCFKENPKDVETLNLLAAAFKGLGQTAKTLSVYRELGRLHAVSGNVEAQRSVMRKILAIEPNDADAQRVLEQTEQLPDNALGRIQPTQKAIRRNTDVVEVNRAADDQRAGTPPPPPPEDDLGIEVEVDSPDEERANAAAAAEQDVEEQINRILIEADVYIKYGLKTKAIEHIRKVFGLRSHHREARLRYKDLLIDTGELDTAVAELMLLAKNAADRGDASAAISDLRELLGYDPGHAQARDLLEELAPGASELQAETSDAGEVPVRETTVSREPTLSYDPSPAAASIDLDDEDEGPRAATEELLDDADAGLDDELVLAESPEINLTLDPDPSATDALDAEAGTLELDDDATPPPAPFPGADGGDALGDDADEDAFDFQDLSGEEVLEVDEGSLEDLDASLPELEPPGEELSGLEDLDDGAEPEALASESSDVSVRSGESEVHFGRPTGARTMSAPANEKTISGETVIDFGSPRELEPVDDEVLARELAHEEADLADPDTEASEPSRQPPTPVATEATPAGLDDLDALLASAVPTKRKDTVDRAPTAAPRDDAPPEALESRPQPPAPEVTAGESTLPGAGSTPDAIADDDLDDLSDEIEEIAFFIEQGLEDEAREQLDALLAIYGERPDLLDLQAKLDPAEEGDAPGAAEASPAPTADDDDQDEGIASVDLENVQADLAAGIDELAAGDDFQIAFQDVFDEFKKGVAEVVEEGDFQTHYDLGIAYKEMGLYDDAIREFEHAAASDDKAIGALTMMGLCALAAGDSAQALSHFLRGINSDHVTPEESLALRFEIGLAYESMGRLREAVKFFEKVDSIDPEFRGVADRLTRVRSRIADEDANNVEGIDGELDELLMETEAERNAREKGDKISYI